jgi:hypothetical protein
MRIVCQTFSLPKQGRELVDYEDASYPYCENQFTCIEAHPEIGTYRCAVTDGATDSVFSKQWAQILAAAYGAGEWAEELRAESLVNGQAQWQAFVSKQELPWYAEEKVQLGAFSAFVGLTILNDGQQWRAVAVGDSCLFHTRDGKVLDAFPITKSTDFSNFPYLLASLPEKNQGVFEKKSLRTDGRWESGDVFLLMSDALAAWFLQQVEGGYGEQLIDWLTKLELQDVFAEVVQTQRTQLNQEGIASMRDDDVTLVRVCVGTKAAPMPVSSASGTSTADSISTLTLDNKEKEIVRSRAMNNEAQNETPSVAPSQPSSRPQPPKSANASSAAAAPSGRAPAFPQSAAAPPAPPAPTAGSSSGGGNAQRQAEREKAAVRRKVILAVGAVGLISIIAAAANSMMHSKANTATKAAAPAEAKAEQPQAVNPKKPGELQTKGNKHGTARGARRRAPEAKSDPEHLLREGTAGIDSGADRAQTDSRPDSGDHKRQHRESPGEVRRSTGTTVFPGFKEEPAGKESLPVTEDSAKELH